MSVSVIVREVQSKLLPPSLVKWVLERVVMMLPREFIEADLIPEGDLEIVDPEERSYESTGNDPRFSMRIGSNPPREGWYYLEAALTRPNGDRTAKIYVDRGQGYSEQECIFIPSNLRGSIREVVFLPGDVRALRWDPAESAGLFTQSPLIIHQITGLESFFRRAWRVLCDIWRFRDKPPYARAGLTLWKAIRDLRDAYARSANLRREPSMQGGDYAEWIHQYDTSDVIREVQSKLLPPSLVEWVLERVVMMLPRKFIETNLIPEGDIEIIDPMERRYESTGNDPRFSLKVGSNLLREGWYYLEAALTRPNGDRTAKIYVDRGQGYSERECIFIPSNLRGSIREVVFLPGDVRALRWDPAESAGIFTQSPLVIHKITSLESFFRRTWRILFDLQRFRHKPPQARGGLTLWGAIKDLGDAYARSANLRRVGDGREVDYAEWIRRFDTLNESKRTRISDRIAALQRHPLISVVMPCYNPNPVWFKDAIESVRSQLYPHWELCIADDASTDLRIRKILEKYMDADKRIKVVFRPRNGHISAASNSALEIATGDYVALLDHDDLLPEHALFWVAECINQHPDAHLIYSDEEKIDESGKRRDPYFKCDFNYDLFISQNLVSHLGVYKRELVRRIGGFREGFEGSQDWDLALRCMEQIKSSQIVHIPRVLYQWRMHHESTALRGQDAKAYAYTAAEKALNDHFARKRIAACAEILSQWGFFRVRYALPERCPMVTLIIPTRNGLDVLRQCVTSILGKTRYPNYEILIVDNGSDDPATLAYLANLRGNQRIRILRDDRPFNYSALNNRALSEAHGELVGLINNDIEVINGEWLSEMVGIALQPGVGAVGARLWFPNNQLQHGGVITGLGGISAHAHRHFPKESPGYFGRMVLIQSFSAVTAACLVIRKAIYEEVGGLDEKHLPVAYNDVDFCLRVRDAGYRNIWTPFADLYHHESVSRGQEDTPEKQARFEAEVAYMEDRWGEVLRNDPAYSPNLTFDKPDFSYAWPPRVELI